MAEDRISALWNRWDGVKRRTHLCKYFIQPLEGPMKMNFYPTRGACDILPVIFSSPALENEQNSTDQFEDVLVI